MSKLLIIVDDKHKETHALLAAEVLRKAASELKHSFCIEVRTPQGVITDITPAMLNDAESLLLVGDVEIDDLTLANLPTITASINEVLDTPSKVLERLSKNTDSSPQTGKKIVAITSCPTGIAHTFMAAEGLQLGAKNLGYEIKVETQGSVGARNELTAEEIDSADLVIIAADTTVDTSRFQGKPLFKSGTKPAIADGAKLIEKAFNEASASSTAEVSKNETTSKQDNNKKGFAGAYKHLMTGVSFMLPFVVAGGILIAISFALGGIYAYQEDNAGTLSYALYQIGAKGAFVLMVPAIAGYISFSIADRPGLTPGMVGGLLAANLGAGFLGGIVAGYMAGYITVALNRGIQLPKSLDGLKPVLILPVLTTMITGLLMYFVIAAPVAEIMSGLKDWLQGMQAGSAVFLGLLLGGMMAFDMGGPVNKAAYAFATGLVTSDVFAPMAAVMAGGMTPPLGLALATKLFPKKFNKEEYEAGNAAAVLGVAFVTEGAIPYAARDPFRVIPALILGSAIAGAISMAAGVELKVPHGGIFVLGIPNAVTHVGMYALAIAAGSVITTLCLFLTKKNI